MSQVLAQNHATVGVWACEGTPGLVQYAYV